MNISEGHQPDAPARALAGASGWYGIWVRAGRRHYFLALRALRRRVAALGDFNFVWFFDLRRIFAAVLNSFLRMFLLPSWVCSSQHCFRSS
ncbi:MAG TPA: hypothetical protein VGZ25_12000 [Gemmataceae bacterium]|jgi:hypothetical protein|nr:hypothetical protein [Gemmataceae bacterium]